jgi:hypothetical protein
MLYRMRRQIVVLVPLLTLLALAPPSSEASATIQNISPTPHLAPAGTSLADLAAAIRAAAAERGWRITDESPGLMHATLVVRTHRASIVIGFDASNFWIEYRDSLNLDYNPDDLRTKRNARLHVIKGPRIHANYNVWVERLAESIVINAEFPPKSNPTDAAPAGSQLLIADELEKLDALRERGVLTQEEFDNQKAKLLAR